MMCRDFLTLYNYPLGNIGGGSELDALFPVGSIIIIREPTFRPCPQESNLSGFVRLDSPNDLKFVSVDDPLVCDVRWALPTSRKKVIEATDWKAIGNKFFADKQYRVAAAKYSEGIRQLSIATGPLSTPTSHLGLLYLNRAAAYLQFEFFNSALQDARYFLQHFDNVDEWGEECPIGVKAKGLFRIAKALDGLRLFGKAKDAYYSALSEDPKNVVIAGSIKRMEKRLDETKNGSHDFTKMFEAGSQANPDCRLDVANFVGPIQVEKLAERGGGRGIVSTRDIKVGELLLVERAISIGCGDGPGDLTIYSLNLTTMSAEYPGHITSVRNLVARIVDNPDVGDIVDSLYGGEHCLAGSFPFETQYLREPDAPSRLPGSKHVDMERIEQVCSYNRYHFFILRLRSNSHTYT